MTNAKQIRTENVVKGKPAALEKELPLFCFTGNLLFSFLWIYYTIFYVCVMEENCIYERIMQ